MKYTFRKRWKTAGDPELAGIKRITASLFFMLLTAVVQSQTDIVSKFSRVLAGINQKEIKCLNTDAAGNIYIAGSFTGTVDFDPGSGIQNLSSAGNTDIFFAKYNSNGGYIFAKRIGGVNYETANTMDVNPAGNIFLAGTFMDAPDFDPGVESQNLVSIGQSDIFFAKYNTNGEYIFSNRVGGRFSDEADVIRTDAAENIFLAGRSVGQIDFDPGRGETVSNAGPGACYFAKFNMAGNFVYVQKFDPDVTEIKSIWPDASGNLLIAGEFKNTVDFDMQAGFAELRGNSTIVGDIFIAKYNTAGNYIFAKMIGGPADDNVEGMTVDLQGNIIITGYFLGTADFNPTERTQNLVAENVDIFFAKYNPSGDYVFARRLGSRDNDEGKAITTDSSGNIYIAGRFKGNVDFDPDVNTHNLGGGEGNSDAFIARYDAAGNYVFARKIGGEGNESLTRLVIDRTNNICLSGYFTGNTNLAPCPLERNIASSTVADRSDEFFIKFAQITLPVTTISVLANSNCSGDPIKLSVASRDLNPNIRWLWYSGRCNGVLLGSGNSIDVIPVAGTNNFYVKGIADCGLAGTCATRQYINDRPPSTIPFISVHTVSPTEICAGTPVTITTKIARGGPNPVYKWFKNNNDANISSPTFTDTALKDKDVIYCMLTSNTPCATPKVIKSNELTFSVITRVPERLTVTTINLTGTAPGNSVTLTATVNGAGSNQSLSYQWFRNGVVRGVNSPVYKDVFQHGDEATCVVRSSMDCFASVSKTIIIRYK